MSTTAAGDRRIQLVDVDGIRIRSRHPRGGAATVARHGHRRQHRDVGAVRAGGRRLRHPDDHLRRARCRGVDELASPTSHGRPCAHRRPPRRRARLRGGRRARRLVRRRARAATRTPVPESRPQAGARRHRPGVPGSEASPADRRDAGAGHAAPLLLARVLPQGRADALRRAHQARARAVRGAGTRTHDPPSIAAGLPRAALCDGGVDEPSVVTVHRPSHARHGRRRRSHHPRSPTGGSWRGGCRTRGSR